MQDTYPEHCQQHNGLATVVQRPCGGCRGSLDGGVSGTSTSGRLDTFSPVTAHNIIRFFLSERLAISLSHKTEEGRERGRGEQRVKTDRRQGTAHTHTYIHSHLDTCNQTRLQEHTHKGEGERSKQ